MFKNQDRYDKSRELFASIASKIYLPHSPICICVVIFLYEKCTSESFGALLVSMYDYSQELNCYENLYRQGIALLMVFCFSFPTESSGAAIIFFKCCLLKLYLL